MDTTGSPFGSDGVRSGPRLRADPGRPRPGRAVDVPAGRRPPDRRPRTERVDAPGNPSPHVRRRLRRRRRPRAPARPRRRTRGRGRAGSRGRVPGVCYVRGPDGIIIGLIEETHLNAEAGSLLRLATVKAYRSGRTMPSGVVHELPVDLPTALIANAKASDAWKDITPLARNEFILLGRGCRSRKRTRKRRIRRTQEELEEGQRRPCCWPGCRAPRAHRAPNRRAPNTAPP